MEIRHEYIKDCEVVDFPIAKRCFQCSIKQYRNHWGQHLGMYATIKIIQEFLKMYIHQTKVGSIQVAARLL